MKKCLLLFLIFLSAAPAVRAAVIDEQTAAEAQSGDSFFDFHGSIGEEEGKFQTYVPPVSGSLLNETPQITTELRPMFWFHKIPKESVVGDGNVYLVAMQARIALTERLGFIATKDGYAWIKPEKTLDMTADLPICVWSQIRASLQP